MLTICSSFDSWTNQFSKKIYMKTNNKFVTLISLSLLHASCAYAEETAVKVGGKIDCSAAMLQQEPKDPERPVTQHNENFGLLTIADIYVDVSNEAENGIKYGAKLSAQTTTKNTRSVPSFLYFESGIGRFEFGSNRSAYSSMSISGFANACSSSWSRWEKLDKNVPYITSTGNFLDSYNRTSGETEYSRKISYYTPEINGWKLGISYIPDTSNTGYGAPGDNTLYPMPAGKYQTGVYKFAFKDALAGGVSWTKDFDNGLNIQASVVAEKGEVQYSIPDKLDDPTFTNLMSFMVGGRISFKDFSIASSYTNIGDSLTSKKLDTQSRKSSYYITSTGKYQYNDLGASLSYFNSDFKKNKLDYITFALDYKLAKGLKPYVECTHFYADGKAIQNNDTPNNATKKETGQVFIMGAKLSF